MLKKSLVLLALTACATSSFAFGPFNHIKSIDKKHTPKTVANTNSTKSSTFTDFSGSWVGKCWNSDGEQYDLETVVIKNDELTFSFDNEMYAINDLKTESHSQKWNTVTFHETLFWDNDKTTLSMNGVFINKSHLIDNPYSLPQLVTTLAKMTMSIENDELIIKGKSKVFSSSKQEGAQEFGCSYKREVK